MGAGRLDSTHAFDGLAGDYTRGRPGYPELAIELALDGLALDALLVDVGCGTGISTRQLANSGRRTIGIEPNPEMAQAAREEGRVEPAFEVREAHAEALGLANETVDQISCFQSFHWFDQSAALAEFARVLAPGGRILLVWNQRDLDDPFTMEYERIIQSVATFTDPMQPSVRSDFDRAAMGSEAWRLLRREVAPMRQPVDPELIVARASSASYFPSSGPDRDQATLKLRELAESTEEPALAYRTLVALYEPIRS